MHWLTFFEAMAGGVVGTLVTQAITKRLRRK